MYKDYESAEYEVVEASAQTRRNDKVFCTNVVLAFLAALLTFAIGLIVGVLASDTLASVLPVIIALAIVFAVLIAIILILRYCIRERRCPRKRCC